MDAQQLARLTDLAARGGTIRHHDKRTTVVPADFTGRVVDDRGRVTLYFAGLPLVLPSPSPDSPVATPIAAGAVEPGARDATPRRARPIDTHLIRPTRRARGQVVA